MLFAAVLFAGALALQQGEVTVRAELSSHTTVVGQPVVLTISVRTPSADAPEIELPRLPSALRITGSSMATELEISMPGGRSTVTRQILHLTPIRAGRYSILPATIRIGSSAYRTDRLELTVGGAARTLPALDAPPIQLRMDATPRTPYVGQQILLKLDAMLPLDSRFRPVRPPSYDPPSPAGFWIQDLPDAVTSDVQIVDGRQFEVQTFQRAYFPLTAGTFTIPPARLLYDVRGGVFFAPETRDVVSDSLRVVVRPLPEAGKPDGFRGAVGSFTLEGELDRTKVGVGDAATYTLRIEGTGNIKALPPAAFPEITGVDVYPPSEDAMLRVVNGVIGGVRTLQWVLIPRRAGPVVIPAVTYSWFDPVLEQYQSATTAPTTLLVDPVSAVAMTAGDTVVSPLRNAPGSPLASFVFNRWFLFAQLIPLAWIALVLLLRRRAQGAGAQLRSLRSSLTARLADLEILARDDAHAFYGAAIVLAGDGRDVAAGTSVRERCDAAIARYREILYAPAMPELADRLADMKLLRTLVQDATTRARPGRDSRASAVIALLMLGMGAATTAQAVQSAFGVGVAAYTRGDYPAAVASFTEHVRTHPYDAAGWHNLGNAFHGTGDPGRAVWAWLHALELEPRSNDVAHNLDILNAGRAAAAVQGWFPVSTAELALLAALCWWLSMGAAALYLLRRRTAARTASLLSATACATALVMLAVRWAGPGSIVAFGSGATLHAGPTTRTEARARLEVGDAAEVVRRDGDWLLVRTSALREGWVRVRDVGTLK